MPRRNDEQYISWQDVFKLWEEVEKETNTIIQLEATAGWDGKRSGAIGGSMVAYRRITGSQRGEAVVKVGFTYPHSQHATMPGVLVNRLYRLLEDYERAAKQVEDVAQRTLF